MIVMGFIFFVIFNCVLFAKWKNVKIAIAVIDATADFFMKTSRINFVSAGYFWISAVWFAIWMTSIIGMLGIGEF